MTEEQDERLVMAMEMMAAALSSIGRTYELQYYKTFPPRRVPRDIDVTHPLTEEEKLRAEQGATGEKSTEDWMTLNEEEIGPFERDWIEKEARRNRAAGTGAEGRTGNARNQPPKPRT